MDLKIKKLSDKFVGRPYNYPEWDCYKLIIDWFKELSFVIPDYKYNEKWYKEGQNYYVEEYHKLWRRLDSNEKLKVHDVILFKILSIVPNHAGIYIGEGKFIECNSNNGTVVSLLSKYDKVTYGYFRLKQLEEQNG